MWDGFPNSLFLRACRWHMLRAFVRFSSAWNGARVSSPAAHGGVFELQGKLVPEHSSRQEKG